MPDYITEEERRLIDAAIEAGKVQKIPMSEYVTAKYQWDSKQNQLVLIEKKPPQILFSGAMNSGRDKLNAFRKEAAMKRAASVLQLLNAGKTKAEIAALLGIDRRRVSVLLERVRQGKYDVQI